MIATGGERSAQSDELPAQPWQDGWTREGGSPWWRDDPATMRIAKPGGSRLNRGLVRTSPRATQRNLRAHRIRIRLIRALWLATFLVLVYVPLALAPEAGGEHRPWSKGGIWVELCLTTGLLGLSTLAATIVLPSRVRSLTESFGIETVLRSHTWLALVTTVVVVAHVGFIVLDRPLNVLLLSPGPTGANRARAGLIATVSLILLCWLSFRRKRTGTRYDVWRWVHAMLAVAALVGTYLHVFWLNHLMRNAAERTVFLAVLVGVGALMINRWIRRPFTSLRNGYVVKEIRRESPTVSSLVLSPARRRQRPMRYRPGQFAWIRLDSPFGPLQGNPFSLSSGIDTRGELRFTIRNAGDFTATIGQLRPGRRVFVDGPYGDFNDDRTGADSLLLIGAGVGMAPMMSILRSHAFRGDRRPHCLVVAARSPAELLFTRELEEMRDELQMDVIEVVSDPPDSWKGVTGRVDAELLEEILEAYGLFEAHVFICGPPSMMEDCTQALAGLGVDAARVHTEQFDMV
ncbi:MAG TPA: ferric reductase-like transmembrane domain-containing protein [Kineosporiaceae bacterium]|nr:ferric reductase-like transmembrane domain-containing protein [Kineosporiaceae bacterium]